MYLRHLMAGIQRVFWIRLNFNYFVTTSTAYHLVEARLPCQFVPMTDGNCHKVAEFRESDRISQYGEKLKAGELGCFAECGGRMAGSIWATVNRTRRAIDARGYLRLAPDEAVIHDIVTGVASRGLSIGPFMTSRMIETLLVDQRVARVLIDVRVTNASSNRMMAKVGLHKAERMLYISALGKSLCRVRLCSDIGFHGSTGRP